MSLTYNGAEVKEIVYNGTALNRMDYNGVTVFQKGDDWSDKPYVAFVEENGEQFTLQTEVYNDSTINRKKTWDGTLYYSVDGETWSTWSGTTQLSSSDDGKLFLRGENNTYLTRKYIDEIKYLRFALQNGKQIQCHGNIENLLNYKTVLDGNHPPMNTHCYDNMFRDCTSLTQAPELPATTLASSCYTQMFYKCTALTGEIHLPASVSGNSNRLKTGDISGSSATIVFDL
jgi:hypothetical protein